MTEERLAEIESYWKSRKEVDWKDVCGDVYIDHIGTLIAEVGRLREELNYEQRLHHCTALSLRSANDEHSRERELRLKDQALRLELVAENRRLQEALKKYGSHTIDCDFPRYHGDDRCTCGLDAALAGGEGQ